MGHLAGLDALARAAAEHLPANDLRRTHAPLMAITRGLVARGHRNGVFRTHLPADRLVTTYCSLVHGADDHVRAHRLKRARALEILTTTVRDLFAARREESV